MTADEKAAFQSSRTTPSRVSEATRCSATAAAFVYNTGLIGFSAPFVQHENLIVFNDSLPLDQALQQLFTDLLGST